MRLNGDFYRDFHNHRDAYGDTEYDVDDLIDAAIPILDAHLSKRGKDPALELKRDLLRSINSNIEARENDPLQGDFFSHSAHLPLGERRRVKRGRVTFDQTFRRKLVIDRNHEAQNKGWAGETRWTNETLAALRNMPATTVREDVLNEDGTAKASVPEPVA